MTKMIQNNDQGNYIDIELIDRDIEIDIEKFNFGNSSINFKLRNAYFNQIMKISSTNKIIFNNEPVGYYMIGMTSIEVTEEFESNYYYALDLKVLGIDIRYQGQNIGTSVINYIVSKAKEISNFCGCRYLIIDAVKEKSEWYENRGFIYFDKSDIKNDEATIKMYIDFKDEELVFDYFEEV